MNVIFQGYNRVSNGKGECGSDEYDLNGFDIC